MKRRWGSAHRARWLSLGVLSTSVLLSALSVPTRAQQITFYASFDGTEDALCIDGIHKALLLPKGALTETALPDLALGKYKQAVMCAGRPICYWPGRAFDPSAGTLSLWIQRYWEDSDAREEENLFEVGGWGELAVRKNVGLVFRVFGKDGAKSECVASTKPWRFGTWRNIVLTWDVSIRELQVYLDGRRVARGQLSSAKESCGLIRLGPCTDAARLVMALDEVYIWDTPLDAKTIARAFRRVQEGLSSWPAYMRPSPTKLYVPPLEAMLTGPRPSPPTFTKWDEAKSRRTTTRLWLDLCGVWRFQPVATMDGLSQKWLYTQVPGSWTMPSSMPVDQKGKVVGLWHGRAIVSAKKVWYEREFRLPKEIAHGGWRVFLRARAAQPAAQVFLNGVRIGIASENQGTRLLLPGDLVHERNRLALFFENAGHGKAGPLGRISLEAIRGDEWIDSVLLWKDEEKTVISGRVQIAGAKKGVGRVVVTILDRERNLPVRKIVSKFSLQDRESTRVYVHGTMDGIEPWDLGHPKLYLVQVKLYDTKGELLDESFPFETGFRSVCVKDKRLIVNGQPIPVRGLLLEKREDIAGATAGTLRNWGARGMNLIAIPSTFWQEGGTLEELASFVQRADQAGLLLIAPVPAPVRAEGWNDPQARRIYRDKVRSIIASLGHSPSVAFWRLPKMDDAAAKSVATSVVLDEDPSRRIEGQTFEIVAPAASTFWDTSVDMAREMADWGLKSSSSSKACWPVLLSPETVAEFAQARGGKDVPLAFSDWLAAQVGPDAYQVKEIVLKSGRDSNELVDALSESSVWRDFTNQYVSNVLLRWRLSGFRDFFVPLDLFQRWSKTNEQGKKDGKRSASYTSLSDNVFVELGGYPDLLNGRVTYFSGEKVIRQIAIRNDGERETTVQTLWRVSGPEGNEWFSGSHETKVAPGKMVVRQVRFTAPEVAARMRFPVTVRVRIGDRWAGRLGTEVFVLPREDETPPVFRGDVKVGLIDPQHEAGRFLQRLGLRYVPMDLETAELNDLNVLVVGPDALTPATARVLDAAGLWREMKRGLNLFCFRQTKALPLGLRLVDVTGSKMFISTSSHPIVAGFSRRDFSNGFAPSSVKQAGKGQNGTSEAEKQLAVARPWHGLHRALLVAGRGLDASPLLEVAVGKGRAVFSQWNIGAPKRMDTRSLAFVSRMLRYLLLARELKSCKVIGPLPSIFGWKSECFGDAADASVFLVGTDTAALSADEVQTRLEAGGTFLLLGDACNLAGFHNVLEAKAVGGAWSFVPRAAHTAWDGVLACDLARGRWRASVEAAKRDLSLLTDCGGGLANARVGKGRVIVCAWMPEDAGQIAAARVLGALLMNLNVLTTPTAEGAAWFYP